MFRKIHVVLVALLLAACVPFAPRSTPTAEIPATRTPTPFPTFTLTPSPTPTITPSPTNTPPPTPIGGGSGRLIFTMSQGNEFYRGYEQLFPNLTGKSNVFTSNWDGSELTPITDHFSPYRYCQIESFSPDITMMLVSCRPSEQLGTNSRGDLYIMYADGSQSVKVAGEFYRYFYVPNALWVGNSRIVFIDMRKEVPAIFTLGANNDGATLMRIFAARKNPANTFHLLDVPRELLFADQSYVYWLAYDEPTEGGVEKTSHLMRTSLDGSQQDRLTLDHFDELYWDRLFISPDGKWILWDKPKYANINDPRQELYIAPLQNGEVGEVRSLGDLPNRYRFLFSADGAKVVLLPFFGSKALWSLANKLPVKIMSLETFAFQDLFVPNYEALDPLGQESLSPDGRMVAINSFFPPRDVVTKKWKLTIIDLETETYTVYDSEGMGPVFWLPAKP